MNDWRQVSVAILEGGLLRLGIPLKCRVTSETIAAAMAGFERTIVSPRTRFDRWIDGELGALGTAEVEGFRLFTGRAGCSNCHSV